MFEKDLPDDIIHIVQTYIDIIDIILACPQSSLLTHVAEDVSDAQRFIDVSLMNICARRMGITANFSPLKDAPSPQKIIPIGKDCINQWYSSSNRFRNSKKRSVFCARKKFYRQIMRSLLVSCLHDFSLL